MKISVDAARLQGEIDELALISEQAAPVVTRVLFSDADWKARGYVKNLFATAGLDLREDAVGNIFALWAGTDKNLPPVATGSHIDAIPNAGKFDGVTGVLGALEAMRALQKFGFQPKRSIECIIFAAEEPTRFGIGCLGSRLMAGTLPAQKISALRDADGHGLDYWRQRRGYDSDLKDARLSKNTYSAFIELHIEQGALLEARGLDIGIVEKIAAPSSLRLQLIGEGGHAGGVLMSDRHDALLAGAEIALAVEEAAIGTGSPDSVGTTGVFRIEPGAVNSVPCAAQLEIDFRDTKLESRDGALKKIEESVKQICAKRGVEFKLERMNADAPAACDAGLMQIVANACQANGFSYMNMTSRAYHDTLFMAQICPVTMIFIPCRGGVSHRPDEYSSPEQIAKGVIVLAETLRVASSL